MAEVVSLSRVRKARDRLRKRAQAEANAVKFGRTKPEREHDEQTAERARRDLEGHRKDPE